MNQPSHNCTCASRPHECKHFHSYLWHDIDSAFGAADDLAEYDEHDSGDNAGGSRRQGAEKGKDGDWKSRPARVDAEWGEKDGNETGAAQFSESALLDQEPKLEIMNDFREQE